MKRKVFLKRFYHRDKLRIGIFFGYDEKLKTAVRSISKVTWSQTNTCFYLDDSEDNLRLILRSLKDVADVDISAISGSDRVPTAEPVMTSHDEPKTDDGIISLRDEADDMPPRSVPVKKEEKKGIIPVQHKNRPLINGQRFGPVEFTIRENEGLLVIKFQGRYDPVWIDELKSYGRARYDERRCEWLLPWSKIACDSLADYFAVSGIGVNIRKQEVDEALKLERKSTGDEIRAKELGKVALDGLGLLEMYLDENRYSVRTRESYLSALEFFFRYFSPEDPMEITEDEISRFIYDYIIRLGYSASYQNQMVSAIKTFYLITGMGKVNPDFLERPRRRRALPKVFSKEEVSRILNSARNTKHKLLLWLIYSCGLRRSEVTNIKVSDLDRDRGIIHIREGKGRVDRIVPVSAKVWDKIDDYMVSYSPGVYIFEGQSGGRYSSESVYRVFKDALLRAGIVKDVGVHSLRHSYATHLHENGLDIRYIQELLGHKSTRTTEIYTHVSRRNLIAVRSPIEDLDVK